MTQFLQSTLAAWSLKDPQEVAQTPRGVVYRVTRPDGSPAALKLANQEIDTGEANAPDWLRWHDGQGAVRLLAEAPGALLLEWFEGPPLSKLCHEGRDAEASAILADCARRLWANQNEFTGQAQPLAAYVNGLLSAAPAAFAKDIRRDIEAAQALCRALLDTSPTPRILHGDLHHDNIALSARGWLAFDPKVVRGDPHFEFANCLRNPIGTPLLRDPERPVRMAEIIATRCGLDAERLLAWGFVQCALSLTWASLPSGVSEEGHRLLRLFRPFAQRQ
ncbi:Streptomycin 3''-kinase [Candidatus Rhodobacter oscarellae]|uniref:Streptomycin 3''-kinase n=1 Tax=Candidatus Rhodobacter oscarellae TaxID=1675527 RepID=A0A0J9E6B7_9RHOB|nr:aminoglycoside phosphotransferase family protein [Candidatus Rhodobacter lobularis]KMW58206.1 Streptomycin 3''-kinase [Candidatus Rhodobacter lobularis]